MMAALKHKEKRVSESSSKEIISELENSGSDVYVQARNIGIDVDAVVRDTMASHPDKTVRVCTSFVKSALNRAIRESEAEEMRGIIVGGKDIYSKNFPVRYALLRSDGSHAEIASFDPKVPFGDSQITLQTPCLATVGVKRNPKYDSYSLVGVKSFEVKDSSEVALMLDKIAKMPSEIVAEDKYKIAVVKGIITGARPTSKWEKKQDSGKYEEVGKYEVMMGNALDPPVKHPVIQLQLMRTRSKGDTGDTITRLVFDRMRYITPTIAMGDFTELCEDAASSFPTPEEQASFVGDGLNEREVIAVGVVTNVNAVTSDRYGMTFYVDISCSFICDSPDKLSRTEVDSAVNSAKENSSKSPAFSPAGKKPEVEIIADKITEYCNTLGITPAELTADDVSSKVCNTPGKNLGNSMSALSISRARWK